MSIATDFPITVDMVEQAYQATGLTPKQCNWYRERGKQPPCGCGLTAIIVQRHGKDKAKTIQMYQDLASEIWGEMGYDLVASTLGISKIAVLSFTVGFDGASPRESAKIPEIYDVGRAAAQRMGLIPMDKEGEGQ